MTNAEREMRRGLSALLLEAPVEVCRDLSARVQAREDELRAEIERLRAALKEIQAYSVGDPKPRHTWYYDRAEAALNNQQLTRAPK